MGEGTPLPFEDNFFLIGVYMQNGAIFCSLIQGEGGPASWVNTENFMIQSKDVITFLSEK